MRILIAEDERDLNRILTHKLSSDGYSVDSCFDGEEAIDYLDAADYDAVLLDIMMPKKDGYQVLAHLRSKGKSTSVIFLTARDAVPDRVKGLDLGANDYVIKPFSFDELSARLRAVTRTKFGETGEVLTLCDLTLDRTSHRVTRGGRDIALSAKEYSLLEYLMLNKGRVLSRDRIENALWNFDYGGGTNAVDVYIRFLRKKIDEEFPKKLIHTVRGSGYVLRDDGQEG